MQRFSLHHYDVKADGYVLRVYAPLRSALDERPLDVQRLAIATGISAAASVGAKRAPLALSTAIRSFLEIRRDPAKPGGYLISSFAKRLLAHTGLVL